MQRRRAGCRCCLFLFQFSTLIFYPLEETLQGFVVWYVGFASIWSIYVILYPCQFFKFFLQSSLISNMPCILGSVTHFYCRFTGWSVDCLCGWKEFIALSAPSIILVASEWLCFEIGVISLGKCISRIKISMLSMRDQRYLQMS